jgi:hypothetical protein
MTGMEASGAGLAGGQAAGDGGQGGEGGQEQQQGGQDFGQFQQQLEALGSGQEELRQFLMSSPWQQQEPAAQQEPEAPEINLDFLNDPELDASQIAEHLTSLIDQRAQTHADAILQQHVQPLSQQLEQQQLAADAERLVAEFPEMADPDVAGEVVDVARKYAEANFPPEVATTLANSPAWWRATYMMGRALEAAQEEGGETPSAAHLEGGGSALSGGSSQDLGDAIVAAGRAGSGVLPFG